MLHLNIDQNGSRRVFSDDENPRIYQVEWKCHKCELWIEEDEVVWSTEDGVLDTDAGGPYCIPCCPEQPDYDGEPVA
jgi:hypothetical protein